MKIGRRLGLGVTVSALLLAATVWVGISRITEVKQALDIIADDRLPKIVAVKDMKENIRTRASVVRNIVLLHKDEDIRKEAEALPKLRESYAKLDKKLQETIHTEEGKRALGKAQAAVAAIAAPTDEVVRLGLANKNEEATALLRVDAGPLHHQAAQSGRHHLAGRRRWRSEPGIPRVGQQRNFATAGGTQGHAGEPGQCGR
jgi:hypothetical protein